MAGVALQLQEKLRELKMRKESKVIACADNIDLEFTTSALYKAAVLFLVHFVEGKPHVLLTKRSRTVLRSPGEVCLPGGHLQEGETCISAALRETQEEVGIPKDYVTVVGPLPPIVTGGYSQLRVVSVTPVVCILHPNYDPYQLKLCPHEVESAFWTPIKLFVGSSMVSSSSYKYSSWRPPVADANTRSKAVSMYWFEHKDDITNTSYSIWGFTSRVCILASSLILDQVPDFPYTCFYHHNSTEQDGEVLLTMKPLSLRFKSLL